jgi:hypothetical protein
VDTPQNAARDAMDWRTDSILAWPPTYSGSEGRFDCKTVCNYQIELELKVASIATLSDEAPLKPPATSTKEKEENHNQQDKAEAAAAVIAKARTHVVAAATKQQQ